MKKVFFLLLSLVIISCNKKNKKSIEPEIASNLEIHKDLYGFWVGDFEAVQNDESEEYIASNKINIVIKKIEGNKVTGQSIVAGNLRPVTGKMKTAPNEFYFLVNEPGDDKNDGAFTFTIKQDTLSGEWIPKNKNAVVKKRTFKLVKQEFKYNPKLLLPEEGDYVDYYDMKIDTIVEELDGVNETYYEELYRTASDVIIKTNASTTKLTEKDIKNFKKLELEIIRNTIFARHGYTFKKKNYRQFFDPVAWYIPVSKDVSKDLTPLEKENIILLERFEKYAEDNYDTFGR